MISTSSSTSGIKGVTRRYLYDQLQQLNFPTLDEKFDHLEKHLLSYSCNTEDKIRCLKKRFGYFKSSIKVKWSKAHRKEDVFKKTNKVWLDGTFELPSDRQCRPGRPSKPFSELSERSKRRKTEQVRTTVDDEVIIHAAQTTLRERGKRDASQILKNITNSPTRAGKYKKAFEPKYCQQEIRPLTPQEALAMFVEADLTKRQYEVIRSRNKALYPCYNLVIKAKQDCYPPKECIRVTSTCAESTLQSLMNNTVTRFSIYLEEVLTTLNEQERNSLLIICKWGCDGSQQAKYKQKFDNDADSDGHIFLSSFVPIQIVCGKDKKKVIWQNPTPSSPKYCRPIRFRFLKENTDVTKEEISFVEESAQSLVATEVILNGKTFLFGHILKMTMVDGKVCNAATGTKSTTRCYICNVTSKDFNNLDLEKKVVSKSAIEFGLSVLHARIRLLESILHLAYKLPVKKYRQKRSKEEKIVEEEMKLHIQERFRKETGLLIDMPKVSYGNTNDGNTSRRFFENVSLAAEITGIDHNLLYRLKVILEVISSGHKIDTKKYDKYALDTAKLYVQLYGWHPMTPSMHKILIHGATIIENALLPIGQLSEEAQEARNKHFRMYRENFARKFSREDCNRDIYNRLLLSSDPLLSSTKQIKKRCKSKSFCPETIDMLISAEPYIEATTTPDSSDSEQDL